MLRFLDSGMWSWVEATGDTGRSDLAMLESLLMLSSSEPDHPWWDADGYIHYLRKHETSEWRYVLRGFVPNVLPRLREKGIQVEHVPEVWTPRNYNTTGYDAAWGKLLNDIQRWGAETMWKCRDGIFELPTRFGKTYVSSVAYLAWGRPQTAVLVPRADIVQQSVEEISAFLGEPVGHICSEVGPPNLQNLTYISLATLFDRNEGLIKPEFMPWIQNVEAVNFDEVHIHGALAKAFHDATWQRKIQVATSATPFTDDVVKNKDLEGYFGPVRAKMRTKQAADLGLLSQMLVRVYDVHFNPQMIADAKGVKPNDYYMTTVVLNPVLNDQIALIAKTHMDAGEKVVIFVDRVRHGEELHPLIPGSVANVGPVNKKRKQQTKKDFNEGDLQCVITTKRWREGITLHTDVIINAEGMKAAHLQRQKFGRGLLPKVGGKPLVLYDFVFQDNPRNTLRQQSLARLKTYKIDGWPIKHCGQLNINASDLLAARR